MNKCESGAFIFIKAGHFYHFNRFSGLGTNMGSEVITLWGVLLCGNWLSIKDMDVYGDSKALIQWVANETSFNPPTLSFWMLRIKILIKIFDRMSFSHIYGEKNGILDALSKDAYHYISGEINYNAYFNNYYHESRNFFYT